MQVHFYEDKGLLESLNRHREVYEKHVYIHFKGNLYFVESIALDSESCGEVVVYRSLKDNQVWVRPLEEFLSIKQTEKGYTYRFMMCEF